MNAFDIIGPIMIGPSSSHTAGACRIGNYARAVLGEEPMNVTIRFSGSFRTTYKGHGTDKALIGGLLGYKTDDIRIRDSLELIKKDKRNFQIIEEDIELAHPNTALITMRKKNGETVSLQGASVGGGNILITKINNVDVSINGLYDAIIVGHKDIPGMIYKITKVLFEHNININSLTLHRTSKHGDAVVIIEVDNQLDKSVENYLIDIENVTNVSILSALR